ncbi:hypothetical protein AURDEDRAFT_110222 [Auricularia subglabra TFB-10046 SS5]|nr:hypothetical protein AURDEDRAFT_110222 [Auricularia subglabra TFB-10046 SS5]
MFAGTSMQSLHHAGPSRLDSLAPHERLLERAHRHRLDTKGKGRDLGFHAPGPGDSDDEDKMRAELLELLKKVEDRLASELRRAEAAEERAREADARTAALKVAQYKLEVDTKQARESARAYQAELRNARTQIEAGQSEIDRLASERDEAESAAARARDTARKATAMLTVEAAREEGRREGVEIGRREALRLARVQGWEVDDDGAPPAAPPGQQPSRRRSLPTGDDLTSPTRTRRPRRQGSEDSDTGPRPVRRQRRPPIAQFPDPAPPAIPDVGPIAATPAPRNPLATPLPHMAQIGRADPTPSIAPITSPQAQRRIVSPKPSRARAGSVSLGGRAVSISAPMPVPGRSVSPTPTYEHHIHPPVSKLPDTYIPTLDEDSEVPFPLPPPHELGPMPPTPSMSTAPLDSSTAPTPGNNITGGAQAAAATAAKAVARGVSNIFRRRKRSSSSVMSDLTMLQEPTNQPAQPQVHEADPAGRRAALSVIIEGGEGGSPGPSRTSRFNMPPPRPIFSPAEPPAPLEPQHSGSRAPSATPSISGESGLREWNAREQHRRRVASELRNSDPDPAGVELPASIASPKAPASVRSQATSYYHRFNRPKVRMPDPLGPSAATVAQLQEQAEAFDTAPSVSVSSRGPPSDGRYPMPVPYGSATPARSAVSIGASSARRKPPPSLMQTPDIRIQPPTRNNSFQPPHAGSVFPGPVPHPVTPSRPPSVQIVSPVPTRPRSTVDGPAITISRPHSGAAELRPDASPGRGLRRSASQSSMGSAHSGASSMRSRRSAYKQFNKDGYVDPAFMATRPSSANPFAPGTQSAAYFERSRPPSPAGSYAHAPQW